uniref:Rhodopsin n=1 Tax=Cyphocharax magdalenae TaxID=190797 RepID=A0A6M4ZWE9_9TELE|nr:rhodopsin 1_2 [Cyphocharax magdalenae]
MSGTEGPGFFVPISNETGLVRSPFEYPQFYLADPWVYYLLAGYIFLLMLASFILNALTIHVTIEHQKLRTPLNYLLLNLSMANIFMVVGGYSSTFYAAIKGYFAYGHAGCNTEALFHVLSGQITLWSLVVLSMERFMVVCKPLKKFRFRRMHACFGVGVAWMLAYACALPPLMEWSRYIPEGLQCSCGVDYYTMNVELNNESYMIYLSVIQFAVPLVIIFFCYALVFICKAPDATEESETTQKVDPEVTRMVFAMIVAYVVFWLPYRGMGWYIFTHPEVTLSPYTMTILSFLTKTSTLCNPVIYLRMNKSYRECLFRTLQGEEDEKTKTGSSVSPQ